MSSTGSTALYISVLGYRTARAIDSEQSSPVRSETVPAPMVDVGSNRHFRSSPSLIMSAECQDAKINPDGG
eukprot:1564093-Rhodomonas_salina.1